METASPAESSAGEVIFEPDESRARDCESFCEDFHNCVAADCAVMFVFMTIADSFHESWMFYSAASLPPAGLFNGRPQFPSGALRLPDAVTFPTRFHR